MKNSSRFTLCLFIAIIMFKYGDLSPEENGSNVHEIQMQDNQVKNQNLKVKDQGHNTYISLDDSINNLNLNNSVKLENWTTTTITN